MPISRTRVAVIYGGRSGEHEISLRSAESILKAMDRAKYEIAEYFISKEGKWRPGPILPEPGAYPEIDVVFPVLHGTFGEDGTMQGLLELADLPYVGSGVLASSLAMDKAMCKQILRAAGIRVTDWLVVTRAEIERDVDAVAALAAGRFSFPIFTKPANLGSSVGVVKAHDAAELVAGLRESARYDRRVLVEPGVNAREIEVSVLGNSAPQASAVGEVVPSHEFYDYEAKYVDEG